MLHSPQSWLLRGETIACLNAWEANVQFCWAGCFCVASLLGRAVMHLFQSLSVFMFGSTVVQRSGKGGQCFVPRWNTCHSDMPGRERTRGHNGSGSENQSRLLFFSTPSSIWSTALKKPVLSLIAIYQFETHRKVHTLYTYVQMTQLVILSAWCAVTNKRLLYVAAV